MIHDAQTDYYGQQLATCSSDRTIRIFDITSQQQPKLTHILKGHDGPVWQISWSHPKFGSLLASCSYDGRVFIWKKINGEWSVIKEHDAHEASVNSVTWAPHECGLVLACASSDGKVSVLTAKEDGQWDSAVFHAHQVGCNAVSWAPTTAPASLLSATPSTLERPLKLVTGGSDNLVRIFKLNQGQWEQEEALEGHSDWVRDVAWAPNFGLTVDIIASCSQDKRVIIWTKTDKWSKKELSFNECVWRLSWSITGNILAVSCGDNKVSLWKESLSGDWECIQEVDEQQIAQ